MARRCSTRSISTSRAGIVTGLLGPSGSGKTTLLRAVVGTQRIASGTVTVLGRPAGSPELRRLIGYASQQASVYDDLTVQQNVRYFAAALGAPRGDDERVIDEVDLGAYRSRLAGRLSGGQRSRVSLAVALLGRPRLLVLDEPTVGLDPVLREQLWSLFASLAARRAHAARVQPRHGRGRTLRAAAARARRTPARPRHPGRAEAAHRHTGMDAAFLALVTR